MLVFVGVFVVRLWHEMGWQGILAAAIVAIALFVMVHLFFNWEFRKMRRKHIKYSDYAPNRTRSPTPDELAKNAMKLAGEPEPKRDESP